MASDAHLYITVDVGGADRELRRLEHGFDLEDLAAFEAVLTAQFQATQQAVHVRTGKLKASGTISSRTSEHAWHGEISYSAIRPASRNSGPADYAPYEQARGGAHDFIAPAEALDGAYEGVVMRFLRGY